MAEIKYEAPLPEGVFECKKIHGTVVDFDEKGDFVVKYSDAPFLSILNKHVANGAKVERLTTFEVKIFFDRGSTIMKFFFNE